MTFNSVLRSALLTCFLSSVLPSVCQKINLSEYRLVRHSSAYDANQCGHLVVDGSMDTYWESFWDRKNPTQPQWLQMEMNATDKLQELVIHWGVNHAKTYSISGLNKHNEWETLHQSSQGVGGRETITLDNVQVSALKLMVEDFKDPFRGCI
ncbi:MAG: discoidin domain-containing protein, partial [Marinoscillum sp.]